MMGKLVSDAEYRLAVAVGPLNGLPDKLFPGFLGETADIISTLPFIPIQRGKGRFDSQYGFFAVLTDGEPQHLQIKK